MGREKSIGPLKPEFQEIIRLSDILYSLNIEHELVRHLDGYKLKSKYGYVLEDSFSAGAGSDKLEIRGFNIQPNKYKGFMTAEAASEYFIQAVAEHV